jgi:S1-C subfamily serine protease
VGGIVAGALVLLGVVVGGVALFLYYRSSAPNDSRKEEVVAQARNLPVERQLKQEKPARQDEDAARPMARQEEAPQPAAAPEIAVPNPQPAPARQPAPGHPLPEGRGTAVSARLLEDIKKATVFVKLDQGLAGGSGSGFLIKRDGLIGYVVTNHHVIEGESNEDFGPFFGPRFRRPPTGPPVITAVFGSGTPLELSVRAEVLASDKERDLAILQVRGIQNLPTPIDTSRPPELVETTPVYLFGFPLGELLDAKRANPAVTVSQGAISALRRDRLGQLDHIQLDIDMNPGNSGGPAVDNQGRLIGIAVSGFRGTRINRVIPPNKLTELVAGRISSAMLHRAILFGGKAEVLAENWNFDSNYRVRSSGSGNVRVSSNLLSKVRKGVAELEMEVKLVDPLRKIKQVAVRYRKSEEGMADQAAKADGAWPVLEGAERLQLNFEGQKATATLELRDIKVTDRYVFQVEFQNTEGQAVYTQAHAFALDRPKPEVAQNPGGGAGNGAPVAAHPDRPPPAARKLFQQRPREYLSDLEEFDVKSGPWPVSKNGDLGDPEHKAIQIDGVRSPKGLSMHPPDLGYSSIKYRIGKQASLLKAKVALNDSTNLVFDTAVFEVWGDGKRLWRSDPIHEPKRPQDCSVEVAGVDILELRVNATTSHFGLHAVWFEPRLLQKKDTPDK